MSGFVMEIRFMFPKVRRRRGTLSWPRVGATLAAALLSLGLTSDARAQSGSGVIEGTVSAVGSDGQPFRIPGVALQLRSASPGTDPTSSFSNEAGEYTFRGLQQGAYTLEASLQGFKTVTKTIVLEAGRSVVEDIRLDLEGVHEEITITAPAADGLQERQTAPPAEIQQRTMRQLPLVTEHFQSALPLVPGVVRGPDGLLNVKGARESQNGLRVNTASVADPVTGQFAFRLPIEAVQSLQIVTSPYAPEYGQVSGGITKIETNAGTNQWKFEVQNLEPRIRWRGGQEKGIESWTPRAAVGGPLVPQTLTLFESVEYQFTKTRVEGLPALESDTKLESLSSFTRVDWTAGRADYLSVAVAVFPQKLGFLGLDTFNPQPVTPNLRQRGYLWTTTERHVLHNAFLESHVSVTQLDTDVFPSTTGPAMILASEQNAGSYFNSQRRNTRRYEGLGEYSVTPGALGGSHLVKIGVGASHDSFNGDTESRSVVIVRADGSRAEEIDFPGPTTLSREKTDVLAFIQDAWTVQNRLTLDYGVRYDWDNVASAHHVAPRLGFAFVPSPGGRIVARGGVALFYDKITLNAATFDALPARIVTRYGRDGRTLIGLPIIERPVVDGSRLRNPESVVWNLEVDRKLTRRLALRVGYQQRAGSRELVVDPRTDPALGGVLLLANAGRSRYRELEFVGRYQAATNQLVVSYVRSTATGELNDLNAFFANVENPVIRPNERSRLPFDAPNRFLAWASSICRVDSASLRSSRCATDSRCRSSMRTMTSSASAIGRAGSPTSSRSTCRRGST